ncbi:serine/threonine-protein kinase [Streptomyces sp. DSM 41524]|uniref:Serine/threonine-protein kinase n=1 Tax=Streptomyces asiaticus subsp. ignotus TaxID=3098222 RepID=A0ABU7PX17_9ACTN|nr:serine/threonine-protein kinase [Streptomyces sp. DSM 41524]
MADLMWGSPLDGRDPTMVGPYTVLRVLGQGGMGRVYLARGLGTRLYAVKVIRPHLADEDGFRARFLREASAARAVSGAFTAPVVEVSPSDAELLWMAVAFVAAPPLDILIERAGVLPPAGVWWIAAGIAEALLSVHGAELVHRDLKPANVLVTADGPRVIDFGIAKALDAVSTASTNVMGTSGFMAPEHIRGAAGRASDVFALGAVMVFAATGHAPFEGPSAGDVLARTLYQPPNLNALPSELADVVGRCLSKEPEARPTLSQMLEEFRHHRDLTVAPHAAASWLPAKALAVIEGFGSPTSMAQTAPLRQPATTRPITADLEERAREAQALGAAGDAAAARDLYVDLVRDHVRVLGADHPDTLYARDWHAFYTAEAGDAAAARDLYADLVRDRTRVLGPDHPDTLHVQNQHARYTGAAGDAAAARDLCADLVRDRTQVLGADDSQTLRARDWHARYTGAAGDAAAARDLCADLVRDHARVLGADHPDTLYARDWHAFYTAEAGDAAAARDLYADLVRDRTRVLGPDHPDTLHVQNQHARYTAEAE